MTLVHVKKYVIDDEAARVYMWTSQRLAKMGQDAQLYCRASGNPAPTVTWFDPEERQILPDDKQYQVFFVKFTYRIYTKYRFLGIITASVH